MLGLEHHLFPISEPLAGLGHSDVLSEVAQRFTPSYLVGGVVRDMLLAGKASVQKDLDLCTFSAGETVAKHLKERFGGELSSHPRFQTATLSLPNLSLDIVRCRTETYLQPGALPTVRPSDLLRDLNRRDFTVNTFALPLQEPTHTVSVAGATADLQNKLLRTLHPHSFLDDPTRLVRGARFAGRLGFSFAAPTRGELRGVLASETWRNASPGRYKRELELVFSEPEVGAVLGVMASTGLLAPLYGLVLSPLVAALDTLKAQENVPPASYLLASLLYLTDEAAKAHVLRFSWPLKLLKYRQALLSGQPLRPQVPVFVQQVSSVLARI